MIITLIICVTVQISSAYHDVVEKIAIVMCITGYLLNSLKKTNTMLIIQPHVKNKNNNKI